MLAIIIPYYKLAFFKATLQSLANQTDKRFKVYIGDDASPEDCSALLKQFEGSFNFEYQRFETNLGGTSLSKQWERCIAMSSNEEWIMILGDDDWLSENVVEAFYKKLNSFRNKYNVVRFATKIFYSEKKEYSNLYTHPVEETYAETYLKKLKGTTRSSLSESIFKRKMYEKYGFKNYPLAWNSDDRAWFDFSESKPIFTINEAALFISVSEESISGMDHNLEMKNVSQALFYSYLLWSFKLNFSQKVEISYLTLNLQKNLVSYSTRLYARIIIKIYRLFFK